MTIGISPGAPLAALAPRAPEILPGIPARTYRDTVILEGRREPGTSVQIDGVLLQEHAYIDAERWVAGVALAPGVNTIAVKSATPFGDTSGEIVINVERIARTLAYATRYRVTRNGVEIAGKVSGLAIETSPLFIASKVTFTVAERALLAEGDTVAVYTIDAAVGEILVFTGEVYAIRETGRYGEITFDVEVLDPGAKIIDFVFTGRLWGESNGAAVAFLLRRAGVPADRISVPDGHRYTGPRNIADKSIWEVIRSIQSVEGWTFRVSPTGVFTFLPDIRLYFPEWKLDDDDVLDYSEEVDPLDYFNSLRVAYLEADENIDGTEALSEDQVPDMSEEETDGFGFFDGLDFRVRVEALNVKSDVYFMIWSPRIAWGNLSRANLYLKYADSAAKVSRFNQSVALRAFPEKNCAIGTFEISKYKLGTTAPFSFSFAVQDFRGEYYAAESRAIALVDEAAAEQSIITNYGIQLSPVQTVASVDISWNVESKNNLPREGDVDAAGGGAGEVIAAKVIANRQTSGRRTGATTDVEEWGGQFLLEVEIDDVVSSSITTTLPLAGKPFETSPAILQRCGIVAPRSDVYGLRAHVYGVRYHKPKSPLRRIDRVYFLFQYDGIRVGSVIRVKFDVLGRRLTSTGDFVDPSTINIVLEDVEEMQAKGSTFGGTLASGYLSTRAQAINWGAKILRNHSRAPVRRFTATLPFWAELGPFSAFEWASVARNIPPGLFFVSEIRIAEDMRTVAVSGFRFERVVEYFEQFTGARVATVARPDLRNDLLEVFDPAARARGLLRGRVKGRKYAGMYHVEIENPQAILDHVKSNFDDLVDGERVLVADYPGGGYVIVARLDGDLLDLGEMVDLEELEDAKDDYVEVPITDASKDPKRGNNGNDGLKQGAISCSVQYTREFDGMIALDTAIRLKFNHEVFTAKGEGLGKKIKKTRTNTADNFIAIVDADGRTITASALGGVQYYETEIVKQNVEPVRTSVEITLEQVALALQPGGTYKVVVENGGYTAPDGRKIKRVWNGGDYEQLTSIDGSAVLPDQSIIFDFTMEPVFEIQRVEHASPVNLLVTLSQAIDEGVEGLYESTDPDSEGAWEIEVAE